jgi:TetR/AcrR family transcriptional repressor of nem operon
VTQPGALRADSTRNQILRAAAHQFAHRSYAAVSLEDIVGEAGVSKGALYSHFESKHALALAIIDQESDSKRDTFNRLLARRLSGFETLIDILFLNAVEDISQDLARARLHLLESIGRTDELHRNLLRDQIQAIAVVVQRAVAEGDILDGPDPEDVGRLTVSMYVGLRQSSDLNAPAEFIGNLERAVVLVLRAFVTPDRIEYFTQFIRRRTALAIRDAASPGRGTIDEAAATTRI